MSDILNSINNKITEYIKFRDYVQKLEEKVHEVENKSCYKNIEFYEVTMENPEIITKLYMPKTRFITNKKCSRCNDQGLIKIKDDFFNAYTLCHCQYDELYFEPVELDVVEIKEFENNKLYIVYSENYKESVNGNFIKDCFEKDDINLNTVYYLNMEDCEELCKYLNKEITL